MQLLLNMKIKTKLFLNFLLTILLLLIIALFSIFSSYRNKMTVNVIEQEVFPHALDFLDLQRSVIQIQRNLSDISATRGRDGLKDGFNKAEEYYTHALETLDKLIKEINESRTEKELENIRSGLTDFYRLGVEMARAYRLGGTEAGNPLMAQFDPYSEKFQSLIDGHVEDHKKELSEQFSNLMGNFDFAIKIAVIIAAATLVFSLVISFNIAGSITKPINILMTATGRMSEGDLTQNSGINSRNEIGRLSGDFNTALQKMRLLINDVQTSSTKNLHLSQEVMSATTESSASLTEIAASIGSIKKQFDNLQNIMNTSTASVEKITAHIGSLTNQIENQSAAVTQSSSSIEQMMSSINNIARIAQERGQAVKSLVNVTSSGGDKVDETSRVVIEISGLANNMAEIIDVINSISSQTNLLSMNAAIEAAHAGEFGKGFAVVADEIRKLAESTGENAKQIGNSLKIIIEKIEAARNIAMESKEAFNQINTEVKEFTHAMTEISTSMAEMSAGTSEVLKAITELSNITQEIKQGSHEMNLGMKEIIDAMQKVNGISAEVSNGMVEINAGTKDISTAMAHLTDLSQKNAQTIDQLNQEIKKFKV
ncbi:MAG: HAMP domain-containing methyl-accepting chemotaxis protein [Spirochaetota bacterium]